MGRAAAAQQEVFVAGVGGDVAVGSRHAKLGGAAKAEQAVKGKGGGQPLVHVLKTALTMQQQH